MSQNEQPPSSATPDLVENPLEKTDPKSLDQLFDLDPELLTKEDRAAIVKRLREGRAQFQINEQAGKKPPALTPKGGQLSLADLGFKVKPGEQK